MEVVSVGVEEEMQVELSVLLSEIVESMYIQAE
jgi:hypothetical protein